MNEIKLHKNQMLTQSGVARVVLSDGVVDEMKLDFSFMDLKLALSIRLEFLYNYCYAEDDVQF